MANRIPFLLVLLCFSCLGSVPAMDIQVILSSEAQPYLDCVEAMRVASADYVYQVKLLDDLEAEGRYSDAKVFVAVGSQAAQYLHKNLPLEKQFVYTMVNNPHELGLLEGRQAIGVRTDLNIKERYELIRHIMPDAKRIGLLYWSAEGEPEDLISARTYLPKDMTLLAHGVESQRQAARVIKQMLQDEVDLILTVPDRDLMTISTIRTLLRKSLDHRVPVCGYSDSFVKAGAAFGFAIDPEVQGAQSIKLINHLNKKKQDEPALVVIDDYHQYLRPKYTVSVNDDVVERLGLEIDRKKIKDIIFSGRIK